MKVNVMRQVYDECVAASCRKPQTHVLTMRYIDTDESGVGEIITETGYCLEDALYFAAWLPYCYPGEYELISLPPPASELFRRD